MTERAPADPMVRLEARGISICHGGRSFPEGAMNGKGHLSIQTSGYREANPDEVLPLLHHLEQTFELEFLGSVADADLRHLVGLHNLLCLKLNHKPITDAGMQYLSGLTNLRVLELRGVPLTAAGDRHLAGLSKLCELDLWGTPVDDQGLEALASLTELTKLHLGGCPVTDAGLKHLAGMVRLTDLDLSRTQIQGSGLALLERFGNLWSLDLDDLPVSDRDVSFLSRLGKLHSLSLRGTRVGDQGAEWLAALPQLCGLTLSETQIDDDALRQLQGCKDLVNLHLDGTRVTAPGLACLPECLWGTLSLTGIDFQETDLAAITHLTKLRTLLLDERVVSEAMLDRLRAMHLVRRPADDEKVAAFVRLPSCPLCRDVIEEDSSVFVPRPFFTGAEFWQYAEVPIHWECFARWEKRPEFARRYFEANVAAMEHNQFWGVAGSDDMVLVSVNPSQYVEEIEVLLAETGSSFRVKLADWRDWLEGEWFDACRHEVEREALGELIPSLQAAFPTTEALVRAAGFSPEDPPAGPDGMVGQVSYEFACQDLARRAAEKGLACPLCGDFSNDYDYRRVEVVDPDGPRSVLVCKSCEGEFGPDDV